jgi:hypothetical protein
MSEILSVVTLNTTAFWGFIPCSLVEAFWGFKKAYCLPLQGWRACRWSAKNAKSVCSLAVYLIDLIFNPDDGGSRFLQNEDEHLQDCTVGYPSGQNSPTAFRYLMRRILSVAACLFKYEWCEHRSSQDHQIRLCYWKVGIPDIGWKNIIITYLVASIDRLIKERWAGCVARIGTEDCM